MYIASTGSLGLIEIDKNTKNDGPLYYMSNTQHCKNIIILTGYYVRYTTSDGVKG
jgi:hypothetical protein